MAEDRLIEEIGALNEQERGTFDALMSGWPLTALQSTYWHQKELGLTPEEVWFTSFFLLFSDPEAEWTQPLQALQERSGVSEERLREIEKGLVAKGYMVIKGGRNNAEDSIA